jgi:2-(1,2-epoxy-1,2-dihydrophenyl)acetyl-CoA isomerase
METLQVSRSAGIVTVTLDRPEKKNAANGVMWDELLVTFREIADNDDDRVVVITGAGGEFCSGADLTGGGRSRHQLAAMRHVGDVALALHRLPQPTIAKVRGVAVGAGCNLALGCDLVVASETARFSQIFARRGLSLDFGGSWILPRRVGLHRAKELALFADIIDAAEADRIGLVNRVLPDAEVDEFVDNWAQRLAAGPPIALAMTKRMLDNAMSATFEQALDDEGASQTINFSTADTMEAMTAFVEKRSPRFEGR